MPDDPKKQLQQQLSNIFNILRGELRTDEFRQYISGLIFYKYLSEKMLIHANDILNEDNVDYAALKEDTPQGRHYLEAVCEEAALKLGYFLKPNELFGEIAKRGRSTLAALPVGVEDEESENPENLILEDLTGVLNKLKKRAMSTVNGKELTNRFENLNLSSPEPLENGKVRSELLLKVIVLTDKIDFKLQDENSNVLADVNTYLIGKPATGEEAYTSN